MRDLRALPTPVLVSLMLLCLALTVVPAALADTCAGQPYVVNPDASQDLIQATTGFLRCESGTYALCYYSGASPMPCTLEESATSASCQCQVFTASKEQPMYVLMTSILNLCVYTETVATCGDDGTGCFNLCNELKFQGTPACAGFEPSGSQVTAPVCDSIVNGTFDADAAYISTFSFAQVVPQGGDEPFKLGSNQETGRYAGCMTASCSGETVDGDNTYTQCDCPVFPAAGSQAPYQFGRHCAEPPTDDSSSPGFCQLVDGQQVWSAAYKPVTAGGTSSGADSD